jgi:hypothetical protein
MFNLHKVYITSRMNCIVVKAHLPNSEIKLGSDQHKNGSVLDQYT